MAIDRDDSARRWSDRRTWLVLPLALALMAPAQAFAQGARLQLDQLSRLADQAAEVVDITIDASMLQLAAGFLSRAKPDEAAVKEVIAGLKGIYVRSYHFEREGAYAEADVETVRKQLTAPGWSRIVSVRTKREGEAVDVYTWREGETPGGFAIVAAEPRELTIVNIVGRLDLDKLRALEGHFGIPRLPFDRDDKPRKPEEYP